MPQSLDEYVRCLLVAFAERSIQNQLRMPLDSDEAIGITEVGIVTRPALLLFLLNETPDFVALEEALASRTSASERRSYVRTLVMVRFSATKVTITIAGKDYKYKILKTDTFDIVINSLVNLINAGSGDLNVLATPNDVVQGILLTSRKPGVAGNDIAYATATSSGAKIVATTGGTTLRGGQDTAQLAPGALVTITGTGLSESTGAEPGTGKFLPTEIAGAQVYMDGARVPLLYVSPTQINAQIPIAMAGASSISVYVRTKHNDGTVTVTTPVAVTIVPENPGIFAEGGNDPRQGLVFHGAPFASGTISVDGSVNAGDVATVKILSLTIRLKF